MNTIEHAETKQQEIALAKGWERDNYTDEQAELYAEQQGLNIYNVIVERSQLFEEEIT